MGVRNAGLTASGRLFIVAGAVAVLGVTAAYATAAQLDSRDHQTRTRLEAGVNAGVQTRVSNLSKRVDQYAAVLDRTSAQRIETRLAAAPRTDFSTVGLMTTGGDHEAVTHLDNVSTTETDGAQSLFDAVNAPAVRAATSVARDTDTPVAAVVGAPNSTRLVVAWPVYAGALPSDTAARRAQATGWVIGSVPYTNAVGPALNIFDSVGIASVLDASDAGPGGVATVLSEAASVRIAGFPHQSRFPVWVIGALTALASACIIVIAIARRRSDESNDAHGHGLQQQIRLLSDISVTLQESLEIGIVLPSALSQIAQTHALTYISVVTGADHGGRGHVLAIGRRPLAVPGPRWSTDANTASPGQLVRLPLQRANRTLGYVEIVPSTSLTSADLSSLRSTTDLLANALHNAELFEREQDTVRRLRDLDAMKDDFLSTVSHELRTPLSVLVGFMSLLAQKWDRLTEEDRREAVVKMQTHVTSLAHLVNDLLDFVSERRNREAAPEEVRLNREVTAVVDQLRPLCVRQQLQLHMDDAVPAWTDPRAVERIVGNLVSNAAKYSPAGSTITVSTKVVGDTAVVSVADQGPGIGPEERQRIFERFYRGDSDAARSTRGSGIGLAVVHEWLQVVGARLDIASGPDGGTTISVVFPADSTAVIEDPGTIRWVEPALVQRGVAR